MFDLILAPEVRPFSVAIGVAVVLALLEIVTTLLGISLFGSGDAEAELDVDAEFDVGVEVEAEVEAGLDIDAEASAGDSQGGGLVSSAIGWLNPRRIPFSILLGTALTVYGFAGFAVQSVAGAVASTLPAWLAALVALVPAAPATRVCASGLATVLPRDETEAVGEASLSGRIAEVLDGRVTWDRPGRASVRDGFDTLHNVRIVPMKRDLSFVSGERVLLLKRRARGVFWAADLPKHLQ